MDETKQFKCMKNQKTGQVWLHNSILICQKTSAKKAVEKLTDTEAH